jgi:hypothetical protein
MNVQSLSLILGFVGVILSGMAFVDRFESWRKYLFPSITAVFGVAAGIFINSISESRIVFTAADVIEYLLLAFISFFLVVLLYVTVTYHDRGAVPGFTGFVLLVIIVISAIYIYPGSIDYSADEMNALVELNLESGNYDRGIELLERISDRYRNDPERKEALAQRISALKRAQIERYQGSMAPSD